MDALSKLALVGSSGLPPESSDPLAREVLERFAEDSIERRILLAAGARAVSRAAGYVPMSIAEPPSAAERSTRGTIAPRLADAISDLFDREDEVLDEALAKIAARELELPPRLLPRALAMTDEDIRRWLRPVLGPRAKWLAQFEPSFAWVLTSGATLEDLQRTFEEGTTEARVAALIAARRMNAPSAREWTERSFPTEKADVRARFVQALETGLSPDDEPFLERTLDDRGRDVRDAAASLLAQLPSSAFVARMTERARRCGLDSSRAEQPLEPPTSVTPEDIRDGLIAKPIGVAPRAFWIERIIASVPPSFFGDPRAFIDRAQQTDWADPVISGLVFSATTAKDVAWLEPLADVLRAGGEQDENELLAVLEALPIPNRVAQLTAMLERPNANHSISDALATLPAIWPDKLSRKWLTMVEKKIENAVLYGDTWIASLRVGARRISPKGFDALREVLLRAAGEPPWKAAATDAFEIIRLRTAVYETVPEEVP